MSLVGESGPSYPACGWRPTRVIGGKIQARLSGLWAENIMALGDHGCYLSVTGCYIYILWVDGRGQPASHCCPYHSLAALLLNKHQFKPGQGVPCQMGSVNQVAVGIQLDPLNFGKPMTHHCLGVTLCTVRD